MGYGNESNTWCSLASRCPELRPLMLLASWLTQAGCALIPPASYPAAPASEAVSVTVADPVPAEVAAPRQSGWCCHGKRGTVYPATEDECVRDGARFFGAEPQAKQHCEAQAPRGWCCGKDRNVFSGKETECRRQDGRFFGKRSEAEERCRAPEGWCCGPLGNVFSGTEAECRGVRSAFYKE
jgi:hypothetical protein